tara:strand:- start:719 stop:886 length:168 start_codon:yes stop_codon:yes gene_type:complete
LVGSESGTGNREVLYCGAITAKDGIPYHPASAISNDILVRGDDWPVVYLGLMSPR